MSGAHLEAGPFGSARGVDDGSISGRCGSSIGRLGAAATLLNRRDVSYRFAVPSPDSIPEWRRYLAGLPNGEDSHPQCLVKGSVLKGIQESMPTGVVVGFEGVPPSIRAFVDRPPLPNEWISEVRFNALMLAYRERMDAKVYDEWIRVRNQRLFRSPLYRVLFLVVSPERLFIGVPQRWSAFRKGTTLELLSLRERAAELVLRYPSHLHTTATLGNMAIALAAAAEAAGAKEPQITLTSVTSTQAKLDTRWL